ncbi:MAG: DUF928 domain-containing protein [Burkholderiales bacterium]|nr:DUF928 domain-containing protein [Burkholderiales bacterium]
MRNLLILWIFVAGTVHAEAPTDAGRQSAAIKYAPPMRGAPASRVGGGSRGVGDNVASLQVLAPDHTGLTTFEQPTLYWYVSKPTQAHFEITVTNDQAVDPLVDKDFEMPVKAGIQRLRLADFGVKLKTGIEYRWYVSLMVDPAQRSNDVVASGTIERIDPSDDLKAKLAHADKTSIPRIYAGAGIWYDALDTLSDLIDAGDNKLREQRAALLDDVDLKDAAASDRHPEK